MITTIKSPDPDYTGVSLYGPTTIEFQDGVAKFDGKLPDGVRQYLQGAGYTIDGDQVDQPDVPDPIDSRDIPDKTQVGTTLRDAAVDPEPEDFLPPTNAGEADPHGPEVVSPEIHAGPTGPIVPGIVGEPEYQNAKETAVAGAVRVEGAPVPDVMGAIGSFVEDEEADALQASADLGTDDEDAGTQDDVDDALPDSDKVDDELEKNLEQVDQTTEPLKGKALDDALTAAKLPKTGNADEKRARLAEHQSKA